MKLSTKYTEYLNGSKFSKGISINISTVTDDYRTRREIILGQTKGKKVVHLGCCDHVPLIEEKIAKQQWLHKLITESANVCVGVDIDRESIAFVKDKTGFDNIHYGDVTSEDKLELLSNNKYDVMVMGEILEHVDNPVQFLEKIRQNYTDNISELLITVPNAFDLDNFENVMEHQEVINSDHKYWFTPFTLAKIATNAGYSVSEFFFCDEEIETKIGLKAKLQVIPFIKRKWRQNKLRNFPGLRSCLVMIIKPVG